jgi:hypothetical protein
MMLPNGELVLRASLLLGVLMTFFLLIDDDDFSFD